MKEKQYENEISLAKFLTRYVYVTGKDLTKLTHDDIKELFPYLKRTSFEYIDLHPGCVECGEVALVNDGKNIIPYYIPKIVDYDRPTDIHI